jgi:hypothetical protein
MNYAMLGFGGLGFLSLFEAQAACMNGGGRPLNEAPFCDCGDGLSFIDGQCQGYSTSRRELTEQELTELNTPTANTTVSPSDSSGRGVITTTTQQESWVSKNKNLLIGAVLVVGVLAVAKYA